MTRVLIAESEPLIADFVERGLRSNGFETRPTYELSEIAALASSGEFDALILDGRLLRGEGEGAVERLAGEASLPTLVLSSRRRAPDARPGRAAVPIVTQQKPFKFGELLASLRSLLRDEGVGEPVVLRAGHAALHLASGRLTVRDETYELSTIEFALAEMLFRQAGRDFSLAGLVGQLGTSVDVRSASLVQADFRRLRRKLGSELVTSIGLVGYRLKGSGDR